jgi:hypothetical protein
MEALRPQIVRAPQDKLPQNDVKGIAEATAPLPCLVGIFDA